MNKPLLLLILTFCCFPALAIDRNVDDFADPVQEARYKHLLKELRCVLCQNQSLADSNAEIAQSLRNQVREMLDAGKTDQEIIDFLVSRYGDFVLYRPPLQANTYLLWLAPGVLLIIGIAMLFNFVRRRPVSDDEADTSLSTDEQAQLQQLLHTDITSNKA